MIIKLNCRNFNYLIKNDLFLCRNKSSSEYCMDLVKKNDYENFICTILLKNTTRSNAFAIRSFNVEIAKIIQHINQENLALMRMKFWEETLDKCFSKDQSLVPKHPVAIELFKTINRTKLSKRYLNNLIQIRKNNFNMNSFHTLDELEKYSEQSVSNVYYLILEGAGVKNINADHAASHLGKAQGIVQQLRNIPNARQLNLISIPHDILLKNNVSQEDVVRGKIKDNFLDCVYEMASRAYQHLQKSRSLMEDFPKKVRPILLPAVSVSDFLDRLQKVHYNIFDSSLKTRNFRWFWQLWFSRFKNKY